LRTLALLKFTEALKVAMPVRKDSIEVVFFLAASKKVSENASSAAQHNFSWQLQSIAPRLTIQLQA
jgi:hypothetical protein